MNTHIKKIVGLVSLAAITLSFSVGAYAMSDEDFKAQLLEQLKVEAKLSEEDIAYVSAKIDDISRQDILVSLEEEISQLDDADLQSQATTDLEGLKNITDGSQFFDDLDSIYVYLDAYYEENGDEEDEWDDYDFSEEKAFIIAEGKEEVQYITDEDLKKEIEAGIVELESIDDEDAFFDKLDELYEKVDEHYGFDEEDEWDDEDWDEEYDFEELKKEIIEELGEELDSIKDEALKAEMKTILAGLVDQSDEDAFFDALDNLYENKELEAYYEAEGIDILTEDDFFDGDFDFETERQEIIDEVKEEIAEIDDTALKSELESMLADLESQENENAFFNVLDDLYEKIDTHYGIEWDDEDWEEFEEFDFETERQEIIDEVREEISEMDDAIVKSTLESMLTDLESEQDQGIFFDKLDTIYDELGRHYGDDDVYSEDEDEFENEDNDEDFEDEGEDDNEDDEDEDDEA